MAETNHTQTEVLASFPGQFEKSEFSNGPGNEATVAPTDFKVGEV